MIGLQLFLVFFLSVPALSAPDDPAEKPSELFEVNFENTESGGCSYVGEAVMDNLIKDCLTLANAGILAIDDYDCKPEAKRLLSAYFTSNKKELQPEEKIGIRGIPFSPLLLPCAAVKCFLDLYYSVLASSLSNDSIVWQRDMSRSETGSRTEGRRTTGSSPTSHISTVTMVDWKRRL